MPSSDSSSLSEALPSDDERIKRKPSPRLTLKLKNGKLDFGRSNASPQSSPEPNFLNLGRESTPAHEYVLADNPAIAVIVMFRSRFSEAFPQSVPNVGPQDIEDGVVSTAPSEVVEDLLCGLLGLVLNRKKNPERGHYGRAVEEALASQKHQWPMSWQGINPIPNSKIFANLEPAARIDFLKTLVYWSLNSSEVIQATIKESYKQSRHDDDVNQPLSIQPWGLDTRKRKHYLIEGQVETPFRIYRETSRKAKEYTWWSVASNIDTAQKLARDLRAEPGQAPHRLAAKITAAIPLFEEKLEKRKRKEYRQARRAAFARPEPGMSLYEGRTRGRRINYNIDDDEVYGTDETSIGRSGRHSRVPTPADGPTFTASGRAVRSQYGRSYGDPSLIRSNGKSSSRATPDMANGNRSGAQGRVSRSGRAIRDFDRADYDSDGLGDGENEDVDMSDQWEGDDDDVEGNLDEDEADMDSDGASEDSLGLEQEPRSLVVRLRAGHRLSELPWTTEHGITNGLAHIDKPPLPAPQSQPSVVNHSIALNTPITLATNNSQDAYATNPIPNSSREPASYPSHPVMKHTDAEPEAHSNQQASPPMGVVQFPTRPVVNGVHPSEQNQPSGQPLFP